MDALFHSVFDSEAFGLPFYRVMWPDAFAVAERLEILSQGGPCAADLKLPAEDVTATHAFLALGFRRICMQIRLERSLAGEGSSEGEDYGVTIAERITLSDAELAAHARGFRFDRFSLDPLLPRTGHDRLYIAWLRNSASQGRRQVAHIGPNICTFAATEDALVIDLLSVLQPGQGIGARLLHGLAHHARRAGKRRIEVVTECENRLAWRLYFRCGFSPVAFSSVLHWYKVR